MRKKPKNKEKIELKNQRTIKNRTNRTKAI